jgi:hypothetical protein
MTKADIGRTIVEDTEKIRIYHGRIVLSEKRLPIIAKHITEVSNWISLYQQERIREELQRYNSDMQKQMSGGLDVQNEIPVVVPTHPLVQAVIDIEGVEFAIGASYQLIVIKGHRFSWDEIESKIVRLIAAFSLDIEEIRFQEEPVASSTPDAETPKNL